VETVRDRAVLAKSSSECGDSAFAALSHQDMRIKGADSKINLDLCAGRGTDRLLLFPTKVRIILKYFSRKKFSMREPVKSVRTLLYLRITSSILILL